MTPNVVQAWDAELGYSHVHLANRPPGGPVEIPSGTTGGEPVWGVWTVNPIGQEGVWFIQHSMLEWRSSAYGIDPDDVETLLDVCFHEWFFPNPNDPLIVHDEVATQILRETRDLPSVWTPGVSDEARRDAHLEKIRLVKERVARGGGGAQARSAGRSALCRVRARVAPIRPAGADQGPHPARTPFALPGRSNTWSGRRATADGPVTPTFELKPPADVQRDGARVTEETPNLALALSELRSAVELGF
ncbi:hypothetical protein GCM10020220_102120 [Nonomuraea rubra]|uniref:hypothetical protein n=1 Tax=Nonomuraea rubra TaxID=46180 RepID=UPI0031ECCC44